MESLAKFLEFMKVPIKYIIGALVVSALVVFSPDSFVTKRAPNVSKEPILYHCIRLGWTAIICLGDRLYSQVIVTSRSILSEDKLLYGHYIGTGMAGS